jgi:hypothetical protein
LKKNRINNSESPKCARKNIIYHVETSRLNRVLLRISFIVTLIAVLSTFFLIKPIFGYENYEYGFSIDPPAGWNIGEQTGLIVVLFTDTTTGSSINVIVEETKASLLGYIAGTKPSLATTFENYNLVSEGSRVIGGLDCYELVSTYPLQGKNVKAKQIFLRRIWESICYYLWRIGNTIRQFPFGF